MMLDNATSIAIGKHDLAEVIAGLIGFLS